MTDKQKRFCDEYLIDCNIARAYMAAYPRVKSVMSASTAGGRLLKKVEVKAYIDEQMEKIRSEKVADAREVLEYLTSVMRGQHTEQVLQLCGDGCQEVVNIDVSAKERLKAADSLLKWHAAGSERQKDTLSRLDALIGEFLYAVTSGADAEAD